MPYRDPLTISELINHAILTMGAGAITFWRDLVSELDAPIERVEGWIRRLIRIFLRATVRLSGSFLAGILLAELVLAANAPMLERFALIIGGVLGWKLVDAWSAETLRSIRNRLSGKK